VAQAGAQSALILPADLPFVTPADVQQMLAVVREVNGNGRCLIAICADAAQQGTNALLLHPPTPFTFHYGPGSYQRHLQEAQRRNRTVCAIQVPGLQFDLDLEADWHRYQAKVNEKQQLVTP
jgi:2-phospho-L-lactate guanylyltransferase